MFLKEKQARGVPRARDRDEVTFEKVSRVSANLSEIMLLSNRQNRVGVVI